jgi:hypothetical protein
MSDTPLSTTLFRQTRIFVPYFMPYDASLWAETVFGRIIRPAAIGVPELEWFWFSRYDTKDDTGDCDISKIPKEFQAGGTGHYRSVRLRYSGSQGTIQKFEETCEKLITQAGCRISDYRLVTDLGNDRHIGGNQSEERRKNRADLVARLYDSIARVILDSLVGPDDQGRYSIETGAEAPQGSPFETPHHLFCNMTGVPLRVLVSQLALGTDWSGVQPVMQAVPVRF